VLIRPLIFTRSAKITRSRIQAGRKLRTTFREPPYVMNTAGVSGRDSKVRMSYLTARLSSALGT